MDTFRKKGCNGASQAIHKSINISNLFANTFRKERTCSWWAIPALAKRILTVLRRPLASPSQPNEFMSTEPNTPISGASRREVLKSATAASAAVAAVGIGFALRSLNKRLAAT